MAAAVELNHFHERGFEGLSTRAFTRDVPRHTEEAFEAKRRQAREEVELKKSCMARAHEAYERGDGATAKQLSNEGKQHAARADDLFEEASQIAFKINNPETESESDVIDLHGQYVAGAEKLLAARIRKDQAAGKTHLHVIVGQGHHSANHVQKIKPAVEEMCQNLGLQYATEENAGRIYVRLQGDEVTEMPPPPPRPHHGKPPHHSNNGHNGHNGQQDQYPGQHEQQPHHGGQQQHHGGQNQEDNNIDIEGLLTRMVKKFCCVVM